MTPKINVKERLTDGEIDLSMSDLEEVPVKDIALLKKAYSLDLSNNRLVILPKTFPTLTHITKLDLSKNELKELPEDFGDLCKLKYLDLYQNKLQHLPLSFSKLKDLKWLDLKDNPLVPTVAKVAGPCLDTKQCQSCAKDVVNFFSKLEQQVNSELESRNKTRKKQLEINQQKKQEEKKMKKKDKQKQRQETIAAQKNPNNKEKIKKENNKKTNTKPLKQEVHSSFLISFFTILIITSVLLFILTSLKLDLTKNVEQLSIVLYHRGLEQLPPNLQVYGKQGGDFIYKCHEKTGNVSLSAINFVYGKIISKEKLTELIENAATFFQHIIIKIEDVYKNIVST